ncbi:TonB-linked outer membrane protein, SusC/RagA family [bacterium A37T11]|nr:TonB-linked outer membrane protein, SusC/RagA family [bacterium A37T11]
MKQILRLGGSYNLSAMKRHVPYTLLISLYIILLPGSFARAQSSKIDSLKKDTLKSVLQDTVFQLEEVQVSTGYQKISPERFVGSAAILDSANYARRTGVSIIDRLDGTIPGILFDKKIDRSNGASIQIRGLNTLGGNTPLFDNFMPLVVIDDFTVPMDRNFNLDEINQNDVLSITVLKDAAAASVWGTRAGNGVIVITTKKGQYNQRNRINISSNTTIEQKPNLYDNPQMSVPDFIGVERILFEEGYYTSALNNTTTRPAVSPVVELLDRASRKVITQDEADAQIATFNSNDVRKDFDKYVYKSALRQQNYLDFSGGSSLMRYQVSGGYNRASPNIKGSNADDQITFLSDFGIKFFDKLEINTNLNILNSTNKSSELDMPGVIAPYLRLVDGAGQPNAIPYNNRMAYLDTVGGGNLLDWQFRPLDEIRLADRKDQKAIVRINIAVKYKVLDWLTVEAKYNNHRETGISNDYYSEETFYTRDLINKYTNLKVTGNTRNPIPIGGILNKQETNVRSSNGRAQLSVHKNMKGKQDFSGFIAAEISETIKDAWSNQYYGYSAHTGAYNGSIDFQTSYPILERLTGSSSAKIPIASSLSGPDINRSVSILGNANYALKDKYIFYASARRDGANIFGINTNNKWKPLWSAGAKWFLLKEEFFKIESIQNLSLKASYGYSGNAINSLSGVPTILLGRYPSSSSIGQFTTVTYGQIGNAPNPDLRWEEVKNINAGLDFAAFNNRISGSIEVYRKYSTDLISQVPLDPTSGVSIYYVNASSLKGSGFELNLTNVNQWGAFVWRNSLNLSHARTVVTKYSQNTSSAASYFIAYGINPLEGQDAFGISSYKWAGLDSETGDPLGILNGEVSKAYNDIFRDSVNHQVFHGSSVPLYHGYLQNSLSWKNIEFSFNISFRLAYYYRKSSINYAQLFAGMIGHADFNNRWKSPGDEKNTNIPSMRYPVPAEVASRDQFFANSEINVARGDNVRLQDARISYRFSPPLKPAFFSSVQLFLYANNLNSILWRADHSGDDPDFPGAEGYLSGRSSRTIAIGININL